MFRHQREKRTTNLLLTGGSFVLGVQIVFDLWAWHAFAALGRPNIDMSNVLLASLACIGVAWLAVRLTFSRLEKIQDTKLERFYELLRHDALTGLLNRTFFLDQIRSEARDGILLVIDVDHFKAVNDRYGHYTGDAALEHLASIMSAEVGECGFLGRLGGEEFAAFLPECDFDQGIAKAEQLREAVAAAWLEFDGTTVALTVSVGAAYHASIAPIGQTLKLADDRLYAAKKAGRNCVAAHANPVIAMRGKLQTASIQNAPSKARSG